MEYEKKLKNRLKRIEGQVRGIIRMIEEEKSCREVVTQLSACRSALDRAMAVMIGTNLETCLRRQMTEGAYANQDLVQEAIQLLISTPQLHLSKEKTPMNILLDVEEGVREIIQMMNQCHDCRDVVSQVAYFRGNIEHVLAMVVGKNIEQCIFRHVENAEMNSNEEIQEALDLLVKSK